MQAAAFNGVLEDTARSRIIVSSCRSGKSKLAEALVHAHAIGSLVLVVVPTVAIAAEFIGRTGVGTYVYSKQLLQKGECSTIPEIIERTKMTDVSTTIICTIESLFVPAILDRGRERAGHPHRGERAVGENGMRTSTTVSNLLTNIEEAGDRLKAVVIDEIHTILDVSSSYRSAYWWLVDRLRCQASCRLYQVPLIGMTATLSVDGENLLC